MFKQAESTELSHNKMKCSKNNVFTNDTIKFIDKLTCYIPLKISNVMETLNRIFDKTEFSIYGKVKIYNNDLYVSDDYYVPLQVVTSSSVDYDEDAPDGYNLVIHKHPMGCLSFSNTDINYINSNFDYSILWEVNKKFVKGSGRIKTNFGYISLPMDFIVEEYDIEIPEEFIEKIEIYKPPKPKLNNFNPNLNPGNNMFRQNQQIINEFNLNEYDRSLLLEDSIENDEEYTMFLKQMKFRT